MSEKEFRLSSIEKWKIERRNEANSNESGMTIEGYAALFNKETDIGNPNTDGFIEYINPNSFKNVNLQNVPLRYNHSEAVPILASTKNKSMELSVDDKGLKIRATLLDTQDSKDMYQRIKSGLVSNMSFAFSVAEENVFNRGSNLVREITKFDNIYDVSIVDIPAYSETNVFARSKDTSEKLKNKLKKTTENRYEIAAKVLRWNDFWW